MNEEKVDKEDERTTDYFGILFERVVERILIKDIDNAWNRLIGAKND